MASPAFRPTPAPTRTLAEVRGALCSYFSEHTRGIDAVYLFGSFARGTALPNSDVDVAILFTTDPPATLDHPAFDLESDLRELLGLDAQIVTLNTASPDLAFRVLRDGILITELDRSHRVAFQVAALNRYWDALPMLRQVWKMQKISSTTYSIS